MILGCLVPGILLTLCLVGLGKGKNSYSLLLSGGEAGLKLLAQLVPTLVMLLSAVSLLRASGAAEVLEGLLAPLLKKLGIPPECALLLLVRPVSGSAALAVGTDLIARFGADSQIGRTAAVMLGASETTFYTISVYFGGAGVQKTRYTIPAALVADLAAFLAAGWITRVL